LTYGQPSIVPIADDRWGVIAGNGYNSSSGLAALYVLNLATGQVMSRVIIDATAADNGLSAPVVYDSNHNRIADTAYAGDLQGYVWKFVGDEATGTWRIGNGGDPLFQARNAQGAIQPIVAQPQLVRHPRGGVLIYVGTGRLLTAADLETTDQQSLYALWDHNQQKTILHDELAVRTLSDPATFLDHAVRWGMAAANADSSSPTIDWDQYEGWVLDLAAPSGQASERIIDKALTWSFVDPDIPDRVAAMTVTPAANYGYREGVSQLVAVDLWSGLPTARSIFDLTGDEQFDNSDRYNDHVISSVALSESYGITRLPRIVSRPDSELAHLEHYANGATQAFGTANIPLLLGGLLGATPATPPDDNDTADDPVDDPDSNDDPAGDSDNGDDPADDPDNGDDPAGDSDNTDPSPDDDFCQSGECTCTGPGCQCGNDACFCESSFCCVGADCNCTTESCAACAPESDCCVGVGCSKPAEPEDLGGSGRPLMQRIYWRQIL
jgi:type IV pilus assembly protein PilY1